MDKIYFFTQTKGLIFYLRSGKGFDDSDAKFVANIRLKQKAV